VRLTLALFLSLILTSGADATAPDATAIDTITLERTACFGTCPVYKLIVRRNGTVSYDGKQFVKVSGQRSRRISRARFQQLAREIEKINFFSFKDEYLSKAMPDGSIRVVTDLPTTITTVQTGAVRKTVRNYYGDPPELAQLETLIDKLTESARWTGK
jgi:hypothetical protein